MEGYLEIFGRKFCEKEISGYGEGNYFLRSENTESLFPSNPCYVLCQDSAKFMGLTNCRE